MNFNLNPFRDKGKLQAEHRVAEQKILEERGRETSAAIDAAVDSAADDFRRDKCVVQPHVDSTAGRSRTLSEEANRTIPQQTVSQQPQQCQHQCVGLQQTSASETNMLPSEASVAERNLAAENSSGNATKVPDNPAPAEAPDVGVSNETPIDDAFLLQLYYAVEENSKQSGEVANGLADLRSVVQTLKTDTVDRLVKTAMQLEVSNAELERLRSEEEDRIRANDHLMLENLKLSDKCGKYDSIIEGKDAQISQVTNDLKAAQDDSAAKEGVIAGLQKEQQDANVAHAEEVAKLRSDHEAEIADLKKKHEEEVEALNKSAADQIEATRASVNEFVPTEVCDLFDYRVGEPIEDRSRWQAIYAYLCFINGNLRQDAFVKRFREFDAALYDAMRDVPDQLAECRARVQRHINDVLGMKTGGLQVCWPKIGDVCNPDQYTTTSDFGQSITEVISAMVYKQGDDGKVLCQSKGKVATA